MTFCTVTGRMPYPAFTTSNQAGLVGQGADLNTRGIALRVRQELKPKSSEQADKVAAFIGEPIPRCRRRHYSAKKAHTGPEIATRIW